MNTPYAFSDGLTFLTFLHLLREAFLKCQVALQFGDSAGRNHFAQLLVLLIEQLALGHQPLAGVRIGRELPGAQLVLDLLDLCLALFDLLFHLLENHVHRRIEKGALQLVTRRDLGQFKFLDLFLFVWRLD